MLLKLHLVRLGGRTLNRKAESEDSVHIKVLRGEFPASVLCEAAQRIRFGCLDRFLQPPDVCGRRLDGEHGTQPRLR